MNMNKCIREHVGAVPGSMLMALCLFMALIGFNPALAFDGAPVPTGGSGGWVVPPGSWSGALADRFQALGYEIASIDLEAGMVTATFDDGHVLTVDRTGGQFWLVDKDQETIMSGTVAGELVDDDLAAVSMTYELADEPGVEHVFDGSVVADVTSNGCVILEGMLDADPVDENVDLAELSYRADGSTASPDRRLAEPPGVVDGEAVPSGGERLGVGGWIVLIAAVVVLVIVLVKGCKPYWGSITQGMKAYQQLHQNALDNPMND